MSLKHAEGLDSYKELSHLHNFCPDLSICKLWYKYKLWYQRYAEKATQKVALI